MLVTRPSSSRHSWQKNHALTVVTRQANRSAYEELDLPTVPKLSTEEDGYQRESYAKGIPSVELSSQESLNYNNDFPPLSTVNLTSGKGKHYQLTFRAKDPEFYYLYVHRRKSPEGSTQKGCQACSKDYFVEVRDLNCQKFVLRMKRYRIVACSQSGDTDSGDMNQTSPKPEGPGTVKSDKRKRSSGKLAQNQIFIQKDGVQFRLTSFAMRVNIAQQMYDRTPSSVDSQTDLKKGTYNAEPNRASLVARVRGDVVRIRFVLHDLEIKPISVYVSRGAQCTERYAYVKFQPAGTQKFTFCAVPLSTYKYRDPMVIIRRQNYERKKQGQDPKWLVEQRRKRQEQGTVAQTQSLDGQELTNSVIVFELNGHRVKLRCGHMDATLISGEDMYDEFVLANRQEPRMVIKSPNLTYDQSLQD
ncbi:hypothetical protein PHET_05743 [Paragonimus heterotremus]|uniref:Uncharacterized protein n=1 Tax=Paragonimus heterotremus TaxID=100268 RepID=A0A8J4SKI1_9TREM|nr:hypothetical protein PHET_05743 [Paragonimus heterotremus]